MRKSSGSARNAVSSPPDLRSRLAFVTFRLIRAQIIAPESDGVALEAMSWFVSPIPDCAVGGTLVKALLGPCSIRPSVSGRGSSLLA